MSGELEAAVADQLAALPAKGHRPAPGARCANCAAPLQGPWCHECGQSADNHKRSVFHLTFEVIADLFHLDGRLSRTLPDLFFRPGRLANDYVNGRLARHVPPFRTFLVALLLFMFSAEHLMHDAVEQSHRQEAQRAASLTTPKGRAAEVARLRAKAIEDHADALKEAAGDRDDDLKDPDEDHAKVEARYAKAVAEADAAFAMTNATADRVASGGPETLPGDATAEDSTNIKNAAWKASLHKAKDNPEYYLTVLFAWGHRMAVLLLPIVGLSLAAAYRNKPQFFIYDHMLVAMNLLSFSFLTNALTFVLPQPVSGFWLVFVALWTPINLFQTLRGAYGSSVLGAVLKTVFVWFTTVVGFGLLAAGVMVFALGQL